MIDDDVRKQGALRTARVARRLTQAQVAERLAALAWHRDHAQVGVTADMVSKWERGEKQPARRYRELLCLLLDASPTQLGLAAAGQLAIVEQGGEICGEAPWAEVLLALGEPGHLLHRELIEQWENDLIKRRELLRSMGLAAVASSLCSLVPPITRSVAITSELRPTPETINGLDLLATRYQLLYHGTAPRFMTTPIAAHLRTVEDLLTRVTDARLRRQLLANHSQVAQLAGRLAFFDLQDQLTARGYFTTAYDSAIAAGDPSLAAVALGHLGFIPAAAGQWRAATDHLTHARAHADTGAPKAVRSWLAAVTSEICANEGDHRAALSAIDDAKECLAANSVVKVPSWFDFYDATRLQGFEGYALLRGNQAVAATQPLEDALSTLDASAVKQRTVFLTDLAAASVQQDELDRACALATSAATELATQPYGTCVTRLRHFRSSLRPYRTSRAVRDLDRAMVDL